MCLEVSSEPARSQLRYLQQHVPPSATPRLSVFTCSLFSGTANIRPSSALLVVLAALPQPINQTLAANITKHNPGKVLVFTGLMTELGIRTTVS